MEASTAIFQVVVFFAFAKLRATSPERFQWFLGLANYRPKILIYTEPLVRLQFGLVEGRRAMPELIMENSSGQASFASQQAVPSASPLRLFLHGTGGALFSIFIINLFLTLITLGIYSFWGRVKIRKYLWSQTEFAGDRFAYHGNGKELLNGSVKAGIIIGVPLMFLGVVRDLLDVDISVQVIAGLLSYLVILGAVPFAMVGARRYRLSRTSWRGIRFSFRGSAKQLLQIFILGSLLSMLTLSLYYPVFLAKRSAFMVRHTYFGDRKFEFDGSAGELFWPFVAALLLTIPTLGLNWFWFQARKRCYVWNHTSLGLARFHCTIKGAHLLVLHLVNFVLLIVTLGLAWSWVKSRNFKFAYANLALEGDLDLDAIQQEALSAPVTGEGIASFFDLDAGFDIG